MVSSARHAITCFVLVLGIAARIPAQTTTGKVASGSISGKVTIKGKPAAGVSILAKGSNDYQSRITTPHSARTDQTGTYRITNLPAGSYEISTITPALVSTNQSSSIVVSDGEQVEDVDISLVPGGVITGQIKDSEGEPLIEQPVKITPVNEQLPGGFNRSLMARMYSTNNSTDDRGIYRVFGLPPGKYKVSVGESGTGKKSSREYYKETFYPSVTDAAKATIVEVTEGSEKNNVDIVVGRPGETFRVAGRVVDGETGRPLPNIEYGVGQRIVHDQNTTSSSSETSGTVTNANGEFKLENIAPGTYTIFTVVRGESDIPAASVTFEVIDRDLTDLLIKTTKGSSLSGVVVLEGSQRRGLQISATVENKDADFSRSRSGSVNPDGTFRLDGLRSGPTRLWLHYAGEPGDQLEIIRVERNGIPQGDTINVTEREHVAGIRVLAKSVNFTGTIRGQLKVENGKLPPPSQLSLNLWPLDENLQPQRSSSIPSPDLDARGRFVAKGLPAGTYQLTVYVYSPERTRMVYTKTQQVIVTDDTATEVNFIIKLQPDPK
jgi:hypothetical protein